MTLTRISSILATLAILVILLPMGAVVFTMLQGAADGDAYALDFAAFWGAAGLAVDGQAIAAFDKPALAQAMGIPVGPEEKEFIWLYPPMFHLVVAPLGVLPFWAAYPLFALAALALYLTVLRPYAAAWPGGLNLALAAPVVVIGTLNGNNGLLTAGLMVFAFQALSQGKEARAGLLISLLTIKPTLGLLLPVALIAGGHWRAFLFAIIGSIVFAGIATLIFGAAYWPAFLSAVRSVGDMVAAGSFPLEITVTWFGTLMAFGAGSTAALAVQGLVTLSLAALVGWAFARDGAWVWKGAVLFLAIPLATPYAHFYEMAFTLAGLILLSLAGGVRSVAEKSLVVALWVLPVLVTFLRDPPMVAFLAAPLSTALLILAVLRARAAW
ncbi:MAG: glycosyltransferase family 87 protein [Pseudomonadota bacterium]